MDAATGMMHPCACTAECGCQGADTVKPPPACDNSKAPKTFDIQCGDGYGKDNSMCIFKGLGAACNNKVCSYGLTKEQQKEILDKHNELRRRVAKGLEGLGVGGSQPPAADMEELVWDDELAVTAQRWD